MKMRTQLKGTGIYMNDDLTPDQKKKMSVLIKKMKDARNNGRSAFVARGSLIIDNNWVDSIDSLESC